MNETLIAAGMYLMYVYTQLNIYWNVLWMYLFENSIIIHWIRLFVFGVRSRISHCKMEPNYPYMCICSGDRELNIPISPVLQPHLEGTFNVLANGVKNASHIKGLEYLLIMRNGNTIISRIFRENINNYNLMFIKSRRHFLSIEYTHPDMEEGIPIELDPAIYLIGNEILSARFVLRYLQYQLEKYVFDERYVLKIMDSKIRMLTLVVSEYIAIGNTEYEKKSIKI
jgi:hypothetical protein